MNFKGFTQVVQVVPLFVEDVHDRMLEWGAEGMINPFKEVYDVSILDMICGTEV